jgi:coenzyme F420 hydrogenase subunit beta
MEKLGARDRNSGQSRELVVEKDRDIRDVVKDGLCMGCGTCAGMCPVSAISLDKDESIGGFVAQIQLDRCTRCGICFAVCPGHAIDVDRLSDKFLPDTLGDERLGPYLNCYIGHAADHKTRYEGSTGGMVTSILLYALENGIIDGALVARLPSDGTLTPKPYIARTTMDILESARSLYCPVPTNLALKEVLDVPGRYAMVGIPCHLHGVRKAECINKKLARRMVLRLGLFCAWGTPFTATDFEIKRLGLKRSQIKTVSYRGKGFPGGFVFTLNDGSQVSQGMFEAWDRNLSAFKVPRCLYCHDRTVELADIAFGDAWLPEVINNDKLGTNVIVARSRTGEDVLAKMKAAHKIQLTPIDKRKVLETQNNNQWKKVEIAGRIRVASILGKKTPDFGTQRFQPPSLITLRDAFIHYFQMVVSSKRRLWWLLRLSSWIIDRADQLNLFHISPSKKEMSGE